MKMYGYALVYSMVGYLGVNVVLTLVRVSGALVAVTVTTMRKAVGENIFVCFDLKNL